MTTNYVAMYAKQIGIQASTGFFFTFMALGMAVSRLFSGRLVDRGMVTQVIEAGLYLVCFCFLRFEFMRMADNMESAMDHLFSVHHSSFTRYWVWNHVPRL